MSSNNSTNTVAVHRNSRINNILFSVLVILALIGVVITDISPELSHAYWVLLLGIYAFSAIYSGRKSVSSDSAASIGGFVLKQVLHWGGALTAVLCVYTLLHTGSLSYEEAGLIILILVALTTFLAGSHVGIHFYFLGALLALTSVIVVYIEEFMWIVVLVALVMVGVTYILTRHKTEESA